MPIYNQICPLVSVEKIFNELIFITMPIYSQICPLVSEEKIFKELICGITGKTAPSPWGPHLLTEQVCFSKFGKESLDDHLCQSTVKCVH